MSAHPGIDVIVVDPMPESDWEEFCRLRPTFRLRHVPMSLDSFVKESPPEELFARYCRVAVIDDVKFKPTLSSIPVRDTFTRSTAYLSLAHAVRLNPDRRTWWEVGRAWLRKGTHDPDSEPRFFQIIFGNAKLSTIAGISSLFRRKCFRHKEMCDNCAAEVGLCTVAARAAGEAGCALRWADVSSFVAAVSRADAGHVYTKKEEGQESKMGFTRRDLESVGRWATLEPDWIGGVCESMHMKQAPEPKRSPYSNALL